LASPRLYALPMRIRVRESHLAEDLHRFLSGNGFLVRKIERGVLEAQPLYSVSVRYDTTALSNRLIEWQERHPEAHVDQRPDEAEHGADASRR